MFHLHYTITVLIFILALRVDCSCFRGALKSESKTDDPAKQYCEYAGNKYNVSAQWIRGFPDCIECNCTKNGLHCCGYGIRAGTSDPPKGYKQKDGTCVEELVKIEEDHKKNTEEDHEKNTEEESETQEELEIEEELEAEDKK